MPPSEQNQTPVTQSVSNIPEYLHLDPIPEPKPPKSKKKTIAIVSFAVIIILSIGAGIAALLYMSGETDRRLYGAIENLMSVRYVTQKTVTTYESKTERMIETKYDLTDPAQPKSQSNFTIDTKRLSAAGELVTSGKSEYFVRFTKLSENESKPKIIVGTWYKVKKSNIERAPELIRSFHFDRIVPPVYGNVVLGNFDSGVAETLVTFIKSSSMYAYTASANEAESMAYNLSLDSRHVGELNIKLAKQLDVSPPSLYDAMAKAKSFKMKYELVIDRQTGNISQIRQVPDDNEKDKSAITTVTYSFPNSVSVSVPNDFKEFASE